MTRSEQLERLYKIHEDIRTVQNSGLWEPLHNAKLLVIKCIVSLEVDQKIKEIAEITKEKL